MHKLRAKVAFVAPRTLEVPPLRMAQLRTRIKEWLAHGHGLLSPNYRWLWRGILQFDWPARSWGNAGFGRLGRPVARATSRTLVEGTGFAGAGCGKHELHPSLVVERFLLTLAATSKALERSSLRRPPANPSIERTNKGWLRHPLFAAHVKR